MGVVILSPAGDEILCRHLLNLSSLPLFQPGGMGRRIEVKLVDQYKISLIENKVKLFKEIMVKNIHNDKNKEKNPK